MTPRARLLVTAVGVAAGATITIVLVATKGSGASRAASRTPAARMIVVSSRERAITWDDVAALRAPSLGAIAAIAPWEQANEQVTIDDKNWNTRVIGTEPSYADTRGLTIARGAMFDVAAVESGAEQAVLGATVVHQLFGDGDPVGATVRIHDRPFEVIGVLATKGTSRTGLDRDDLVLVPAHAFEKIHAGVGDLRVDVIATGEDTVDAAQHQIEDVLRTRHRIDVGDDDFQVRNIAAIVAQLPADAQGELP